MKLPDRPTAWACPKCGKADFAGVPEQMAKPEHFSHRGYDIGQCDGKMIRLYSEADLSKADLTTA